jgi:hypothetical protein
MANDKTTDPAAVFQDWVTQWERAADKFSNEFMGTDEFSKSMNQMQNFQLEFQRGFGELMAKQLANFNFPTREDVLQLSEDVRDIDRRLGRIETAIRKLAPEDSSGSSQKRKSPPRTKKPAAAPKDED